MTEIRRRILTGANGPLPPMYRRCDYLQTTGIQSRIDTGVAGNDETLVFDFDYMTVVRNAYTAAFGNYVDENTRCWRLIQYSGTSDTPFYLVGAYNRRAGSSMSVRPLQGTSDTIIGKRINFRISAGRVETNYNGYTAVATTESDTTTAISSRNIAVGAGYATQTSTTALVGRFWHFKIWSQGALVRNYIPCVRSTDDKAGFYDLVNHTFNPSTGTAEFIAGYD